MWSYGGFSPSDPSAPSLSQSGRRWHGVPQLGGNVGPPLAMDERKEGIWAFVIRGPERGTTCPRASRGGWLVCAGLRALASHRATTTTPSSARHQYRRGRLITKEVRGGETTVPCGSARKPLGIRGSLGSEPALRNGAPCDWPASAHEEDFPGRMLRLHVSHPRQDVLCFPPRAKSLQRESGGLGD